MQIFWQLQMNFIKKLKIHNNTAKKFGKRF